MAKRSKYVNIYAVKGRKNLFRAKLSLPFDTELGEKPKPVIFYGRTKEEAAEKRAAYNPDHAKLDKTTGFVDLIRDTYLPTLRERMEADQNIGYGHWQNTISLIRRFLISPDKEQHPNVFDARVRKVKIGYLKPDHFKEFFAACTKPAFTG